MTQSWVMPPPTTDPGLNPQIYVWGGRLIEARATIPRGSGQKRITHQVDMYVHWVTDLEHAAMFPVLLDQIRAILRAVPLPVQLTDAVTSATSSLTDFGESISLAYALPSTLAGPSGSLLLHTGTLKVTAHEWIEG